MQTMTLTDQRLCRIWNSAANFGGDWYDTSRILHEIGMMLRAVERHELADDFETCSALALQHEIDAIAERKLSLQVAA